jgi:hypothetical protein
LGHAPYQRVVNLLTKNEYDEYEIPNRDSTTHYRADMPNSVCRRSVGDRDAIQKLLADNFQANPGVKLDATIDEVKQLKPSKQRSIGQATRIF